MQTAYRAYAAVLWLILAGGGFCRQVVFEDSFDGPELDGDKWTVSSFAGCSAAVENGSLKLFYAGNNSSNPGIFLTSPTINLPADWTKITVKGQWWWQSGTTGEFYVKLFEAGNEAGNYFRPTYAAWQGPKFCAYWSGASSICTLKPWPAAGCPFEMTVTKTDWIFSQDGVVFASEPTSQMAQVQQICLKLGAWDYSAFSNTAFFDEIEVSVEEAPLDCPPESFYSQRSYTRSSFTAYISDRDFYEMDIIDSFPATQGIISGVRWWGLRIAAGEGYTGCQPEPNTNKFLITFYPDNNGQPDVSKSCEFVVVPAAADTGRIYGSGTAEYGPLYEYTASIPPVWASSYRWISIKRWAESSTCYFAWMGSNEGDRHSFEVTYSYSSDPLKPPTPIFWDLPHDLSFCLLSQEHFSGISPCPGSRYNTLQPDLSWQFDQPEGTVYDIYFSPWENEDPVYGYAAAENLQSPHWQLPDFFPVRYHFLWRVLAKTSQGDIWSPLYHFWMRSNLGDLTYDTMVKGEDLVQFAQHWLDTPCDSCSDWCGGADLNYSGRVTLEDLAVLADHWFDNYPINVNDTCSFALPLTLDVQISVNTLSASGSDITGCGVNDSRDVWYTFTAPADGSYSFSAFPGSAGEVTIALFDGCEGTQLACAVSYKVPFLGSMPAVVSLPMTAGQTVYVRAAVENHAGGLLHIQAALP